MIRLSKYYSKIKISYNTYAIFNKLYFKILYVNKNEIEDIESLNYKNDNEQVKALKKYMIYTTEETDKNLYNILKNQLENENSIECIYIIPSEKCNMNCEYCFIYRKLDKYKRPEIMKKECAELLVDRILEYLKEYKKDKLVIQFYGGEPTLNWDIIKYIVDKLDYTNKITWSIVSNGINLTDEIIKYIYDKNISIGISLDGPININNLCRITTLNDKKYRRVIDNVNKLVDLNANVGISFTITQNVLENKEVIFEWINNLNIKNVNYNLLHFKIFNSKKVKEYYTNATNFIIESYLRFNSKIYDDRIYRKIESFYGGQFRYSDCFTGVGKQITINSKGDITYCNCDFLDKTKRIENIKNIKIKNVLLDEKRKIDWIKKLPIYNSKCLNCDAISICGGGCILQMNKDNIDEGFCEHTRICLMWLLQKSYFMSLDL